MKWVCFSVAPNKMYCHYDSNHKIVWWSSPVFFNSIKVEIDEGQ